MQEEIVALNKNLNKCIDLLSKSMKSPTIGNVFKDMYDSNRISVSKWTNTLDEELDKSKKVINKLYKEKDKLINSNKKEKD